MSASFVVRRQESQGFAADVTGRAARRQLRISVGVVAVLGLGIVSAAVAVGPHPIAAKRDLASTAPIVLLHAEAAPVGAKAI